LERKKGLVLITLLVLPIFFAIVTLQIRPVVALVPSVDAPVPWTSGTHTILNITLLTIHILYAHNVADNPVHFTFILACNLYPSFPKNLFKMSKIAGHNNLPFY
jgi:hypothetical protein